MAGRVDETMHVAAQENVSLAVPRAHEFRSHLERILSSPAFRGSHRSQEFLHHVVDLALQGEFDRIKERILGIEIFRRDAEYDTSQDAIVRVTANEVRKRLIQYYAGAPAEEFRISLPAGSYIPEFTIVRIEQAAQKEPAVSEPSADGLHKIDLPQMIAEESQQAEEKSEAVSDADVRAVDFAGAVLARFFRNPWLIATGLAVIFFALGWLLKGVSVHSSVLFGENAANDSQYGFYKEMLGPLVADQQMPTDIIVSNPKLFLYRGSNDPNPNPREGISALRVPLSDSLAAQLAEGANDTQADFPYHRLDLDPYNYTGMGEAKALFGLGRVMEALGRPARLSESRFLNWDTVRFEQLIVLGAPHMSKWTQSGLERANFTMAHDSILNAHPLPNEQAVYAARGDGMSLEDYGLIWMSQLPSGNRILVLAGITSTGTAGVGSFFSDPDSMRPLYKQLKQAGHGTMPTDWQILLRINARDDIPEKVTPVVVRINAPSN